MRTIPAFHELTTTNDDGAENLPDAVIKDKPIASNAKKSQMILINHHHPLLIRLCGCTPCTISD